MKAKLIRDMDGPNPKYRHDRAALAAQQGKRYAHHHSVEMPTGTIIDNPEAYKLVQNGVAIPADDECRIAAGMTVKQMQEAQQAYEDLESGKDIQDYLDELEEEEEEEDDEEEEPEEAN